MASKSNATATTCEKSEKAILDGFRRMTPEAQTDFLSVLSTARGKPIGDVKADLESFARRFPDLFPKGIRL